ncbi:MAG: hypothetical protein AB1762_17140 [Gemmatimonadota bacterium]
MTVIDNITTVVGLIVFVYLCYRVGLIINRVKHWRYTRAWQPLVGVIKGTVHEDPQGGGASSYLVGEWKGHAIHARMSPHVTTYGSTVRENRFSVSIPDVDGPASWNTVNFPSLRITSDDMSLAARLRDAGVMELLHNAGSFDVGFEHHSRCLIVNEIVTPLWAPPPERFVVLLDLAVDLARVQRDLNVMPSARVGEK